MTELVPSRPGELALEVIPPLDRHPVAVYLASLSPGSRRTVQQSLDAIAGLLSGGELDAFGLNWSAIRYQHAAAVRAQLAAAYKPATANKMLSALRQVLHHAWKLGLMGADDYHRARDVTNIKGTALPAGRDLGAGEIAALMEACERDPSPAGARDAAIIALMYATGIRRASVVTLTLEDFDAAARTLRVREAKGRREYLAHIPQDGALRALVDWLAVLGNGTGTVVLADQQGGQGGAPPDEHPGRLQRPRKTITGGGRRAFFAP